MTTLNCFAKQPSPSSRSVPDDPRRAGDRAVAPSEYDLHRLSGQPFIGTHGIANIAAGTSARDAERMRAARASSHLPLE
jgi:hypothetical protein